MSHDCCESLRLNRVSSNIVESGIEEVTSQQILELTKLNVGELDLLAGGPPCPPYSKSRFYRKEKPRALQDPAAITLKEYLRVLGDLQPRAFLMENVPGLKYDVHKEAFDLVLRTASDLGYSVTDSIVNAANYGVPQIRERLFIVGTRDGVSFEFPTATHSERSDEDLFTQPWVTAGNVLADLDTEEAADDSGHYAGGRFNELLKKVPPGDNYLFFTEQRGHAKPVFKWRSRYWSFLLKLSPNKPSWTIQARRSNNMGPFHWRNRILRIEEIKRLQTFPDDWQLYGKIDSQWRQIGNAVPPLLGTVLGNQIVRALKATERPRSQRKQVAVG